METMIKPGLFGLTVATDMRRGVYDAYNEQLLQQVVAVDAVFIGDSITEAWMLDAFFRTTGGLLVNRGIGGDTTPFMRRRFAADVLQLRPRLVVIMAGINNFWEMDNWDTSLMRAPQAIEDEIVGDIVEMVQVTHERRITVVVGSILPTHIRINSNTATRNGAIKRVNQRLQQEAMERGAIFVDYHQHLVAEDGLTLRDSIAEDGLHPGAAGYRIMAKVLLDALGSAQNGILAKR